MLLASWPTIARKQSIQFAIAYVQSACLTLVGLARQRSRIDSFLGTAAEDAVEHNAEWNGRHEPMQRVQLGFCVAATTKASDNNGASVGE